MASHDDDTMPEETQGYKLTQPKQSLADYNKMGRCRSCALYAQLPLRHFALQVFLQWLAMPITTPLPRLDRLSLHADSPP